jgi:hypothetical protein
LFYPGSVVPVEVTQKMKSPPDSVAVIPPADDVVARVVAIAPAPLLMGEKESDYAEIARRIVRTSGPRDALGEFLIRDVIDLTWEILRLRRSKAGLLRASMGDGVGRVLEAVGHPYLERNRLSENWAAGDLGAREKVDIILTKAGLTIEDGEDVGDQNRCLRADRPNLGKHRSPAKQRPSRI